MNSWGAWAPSPTPPNPSSVGMPSPAVKFPSTLKEVFLTSRTYAGYARNTGDAGGKYAGCTSPEPFAYEEGFAVQRLIVAQINQAAGADPNDGYAGQMTYNVAPWVDWGPYLWASGSVPRSDNFFWCGGQPTPPNSVQWHI